VGALPAPLKSNTHKTGKVRGVTLTSTDYLSEITPTINGLQQWYSTDTGIWGGNLWWNCASVLTTFADLQGRFPNFHNINPIIDATYNHAATSAGHPDYINDYYDDELWWCLAWIHVYDITNDTKYLNTAANIFQDAKRAWGTQRCGGLRWHKTETQVNAIENELYLAAAAKLANRSPKLPSERYYLDEAIKVHDWFVGSGLINNQSLINDGITADCQNNGGLVWSYNQGVILGGLVELTFSTGDAKYATLANDIALAAVKNVVDGNGILTDPCGECAADGGQFKGVFIRNLQFLVERSTVLDSNLKAVFVKFILNNANSLWNNDRDGNLLGPLWDGPYLNASVQSQSSALDALVAAAAVS